LGFIKNITHSQINFEKRDGKVKLVYTLILGIITNLKRCKLIVTLDEPHDPYGYDLWSNGPNGVNEYGAPGSDDIRY